MMNHQSKATYMRQSNMIFRSHNFNSIVSMALQASSRHAGSSHGGSSSSRHAPRNGVSFEHFNIIVIVLLAVLGALGVPKAFQNLHVVHAAQYGGGVVLLGPHA